MHPDAVALRVAMASLMAEAPRGLPVTMRTYGGVLRARGSLTMRAPELCCAFRPALLPVSLSGLSSSSGSANGARELGAARHGAVAADNALLEQ